MFDRIKNSIIILFCLLTNSLYAQNEQNEERLYFGPSISYGYSMYETFGDWSYIPILEVGGFMNAKLSEKIRFNGGLNVSFYGEYVYQYDGLLLDHSMSIFDTIVELRYGELTRKVTMLSIPLRVEFYLLKNKQIGFAVGFTSRFRLSDDVSWEYKDVVYNRNTDMIISETGITNESPSIKFYHLDVLHIGLLFNIKRLTIAPIANYGNFIFKNIDGLSGHSRLDINLQLSWRI